jgi:hypothetical protein
MPVVIDKKGFGKWWLKDCLDIPGRQPSQTCRGMTTHLSRAKRSVGQSHTYSFYEVIIKENALNRFLPALM